MIVGSPTRTASVLLAAALLIAAAVLGFGGATAAKPDGRDGERACVSPKRIDAAERYAKLRGDRISFAVRDQCGRLAGEHRYRVHLSASVVKVMMMVAYLDQRDVRDRSLHPSDRDLLGPMIRESNNRAANTVYGMVGARGIEDVAKRAGMRRFSTQPVWGASEITAGDQARFLQRFERYLPRRHVDYALGLMARIVERQRWGIGELELPGWKLNFKGGWTPSSSGWRVNQVALLRRDDRRISVAILTEENNSFRRGKDTIRGVAERLLGDYRR